MKNRKKKRPYARPRLVTTPLYERYGLACGKDNPRIPGCLRSFKS
ncbi:MAG: hypothetical protein ACYTAF_12510 [Planctomycetota bacterium]|jgi:hypothetical protein